MSDPGIFMCSPSDDVWDDLDLSAPDELSWEEMRYLCDQLSDHIAEWQGVPIPLDDDLPLVLAEGHPLRGLYDRKAIQAGDVAFDIVPDARYDEHDALFTCSTEDVRDDERLVNEWFCRQRQCRVLVFQRAGRAFCVQVPVSPDRSMDRLDLWLTTIGASDAWDLDAEYTARDTLRAMLTERQWRHYDLTGSFMETSPRSQLLYVFRRLRPTIVLSPRERKGRDRMVCLAVLCLHPIGYYDRSWGGCLVPTDDVIAHLSMMRGDEAYFWGKANQHELSSPEAGL